MSASETINHVELVSLDICKFVKPHFIGEILDIEAQVIYVNVKKGLAYVQVEANSQSLDSSQKNDEGVDPFDQNKRNIMNLTYKVDKKIRLK